MSLRDEIEKLPRIEYRPSYDDDGNYEGHITVRVLAEHSKSVMVDIADVLALLAQPETPQPNEFESRSPDGDGQDADSRRGVTRATPSAALTTRLAGSEPADSHHPTTVRMIRHLPELHPEAVGVEINGTYFSREEYEHLRAAIPAAPGESER